MKQLSITVFLAGLSLLSLFSFTDSITSHKVDIKQSSLRWIGYKVTGKHEGNISLKSGELVFEGGNLKAGSFEIDMTSITNTDMSGEYSDKLVNHLKSEDFFNSAKHPTAKFKITGVSHQGKDLYKISGDLSIKGITKPIRFNASVKDENGVKSTTAVIKIDRSDFDVRYGSGSFFDGLGDKTIYDDFEIETKLVTMK